MKARKGQIAILLAAALLAVIVLAVMNVSVFLAVRSKNRAMNAGDAAAIAVLAAVAALGTAAVISRKH